MTTLVHLDVNDSGAWRRVLTFDSTAPGVMEWVTFLAERLLRNGQPKPPRARLHDAAGDRTLSYWSESDGWRPARGQATLPARAPGQPGRLMVTTRESALAHARELMREHRLTVQDIAPEAKR